jgi:hypothetical protein
VKFTIVRSAADFTGVGPREKPGQGRQMVPGWVPVKSRDKAGRSYWGRFGKSYGVEKQNVEIYKWLINLNKQSPMIIGIIPKIKTEKSLYG